MILDPLSTELDSDTAVTRADDRQADSKPHSNLRACGNPRVAYAFLLALPLTRHLPGNPRDTHKVLCDLYCKTIAGVAEGNLTFGARLTEVFETLDCALQEQIAWLICCTTLPLHHGLFGGNKTIDPHFQEDLRGLEPWVAEGVRRRVRPDHRHLLFGVPLRNTLSELERRHPQRPYLSAPMSLAEYRQLGPKAWDVAWQIIGDRDLKLFCKNKEFYKRFVPRMKCLLEAAEWGVPRKLRARRKPVRGQPSVANARFVNLREAGLYSEATLERTFLKEFSDTYRRGHFGHIVPVALLYNAQYFETKGLDVLGLSVTSFAAMVGQLGSTTSTYSARFSAENNQIIFSTYKHILTRDIARKSGYYVVETTEDGVVKFIAGKTSNRSDPRDGNAGVIQVHDLHPRVYRDSDSFRDSVVYTTNEHRQRAYATVGANPTTKPPIVDRVEGDGWPSLLHLLHDNRYDVRRDAVQKALLQYLLEYCREHKKVRPSDRDIKFAAEVFATGSLPPLLRGWLTQCPSWRESKGKRRVLVKLPSVIENIDRSLGVAGAQGSLDWVNRAYFGRRITNFLPQSSPTKPECLFGLRDIMLKHDEIAAASFDFVKCFDNLKYRSAAALSYFERSMQVLVARGFGAEADAQRVVFGYLLSNEYAFIGDERPPVGSAPTGFPLIPYYWYALITWLLFHFEDLRRAGMLLEWVVCGDDFWLVAPRGLSDDQKRAILGPVFEFREAMGMELHFFKNHFENGFMARKTEQVWQSAWREKWPKKHWPVLLGGIKIRGHQVFYGEVEATEAERAKSQAATQLGLQKGVNGGGLYLTASALKMMRSGINSSSNVLNQGEGAVGE